ALADHGVPVRRLLLKRHEDADAVVEVRCGAAVERSRLLAAVERLGDTPGIRSVELLGVPA
ncbi:hypothetical protein HH299_10925, partial [Xanthomonas sp. Kuri4-2]